MLTESLKWVEQTEKTEHDELLKTMIEYKVHWEKVLAHRKEQGIEGERPYPHPDDVHINMVTGDVEISGPMTREEDDYVTKVQLRVETQMKIADTEEDLADHPKNRATAERLKNLRSLMWKIDADLEKHPGRGRFEGVDLVALTAEMLAP